MAKTLTESLQEEYSVTVKLGESEIKVAKLIFEDWLSKVGLPQYHTTHPDNTSSNATESIRQLLITLVNEP